MPTLGRASIRGSNVPRSRPTAMRSRRSCADAARMRSTSSSWRPRVFTTRAPSKLSWATPDTSPTACWARAAGASTRLVYTWLMATSAGNSTAAITASSGWMTRMLTTATITSSTTLTENASGFSTMVAVCTSMSAWARSSPVGRLRWNRSGRSR